MADYEKEEKVKKVEKSGILPIDEIESLAGKGILISSHSGLRNFTYRDVEGIQAGSRRANKETTISVSYTTEEIPKPSVNNIASLSSSFSIFNKPRGIENETTGEITYVTNDNNYITASSQTIPFKVGGDIGTHYTIVVKDITNTKWYNWDTEKFENGYNEKCGHCGEDDLNLGIPGQTAETTYNVFFKTSGSTNYDINLPSESSPWVINQLIDVTTTFKFSNDKGFISDQTTTKTHLPNAILNAGSTNDGKIPITITTVPVRSTMSLKTSSVKTENIAANDNDTVIVDSDLIASVSTDGRVGTITGTIVLGKSSKRDTDILFSPTKFFKIT